MRRFVTIASIVLLQLAITFAVIRATTGDGSFVGLGAMLLAVLGIPVTTTVNGVLLRATPEPARAPIARALLIGLLLPAAQLALFAAVSVFHL